MKYLFALSLALVFTFSVQSFSFADAYEAFRVMPASASNTIIENLEAGFDMMDYDLYEACAQRAMELDLKSSLPVFKSIYETTDPTMNSENPELQADYNSYFEIAVLAIGYFGDDSEAQMLMATLGGLQNEYLIYYIVKALGFMEDSDTALQALHSVAVWVDNPILATELINSLLEHDNPASVSALNTMYNTSALRSIRDEISFAIAEVAE